MMIFASQLSEQISGQATGQTAEQISEQASQQVGSVAHQAMSQTAEPFAHLFEQQATPAIQQIASTSIPLEHALILAGILFVIGLCGVMVRRNFLFMLMSLEIMMNATAFAFVAAGSRWGNPDGQIMFIFILTLAAAEASIGLAILLQFYHRRGHLDVDTANEMRG